MLAGDVAEGGDPGGKGLLAGGALVGLVRLDVALRVANDGVPHHFLGDSAVPVAQVALAVGLGGEGVVTETALEGPFAVVGAQVAHQRGLVAARIGAHVAKVGWSVYQVLPVVALERSQVRVHGVAQAARKLSSQLHLTDRLIRRGGTLALVEELDRLLFELHGLRFGRDGVGRGHRTTRQLADGAHLNVGRGGGGGRLLGLQVEAGEEVLLLLLVVQLASRAREVTWPGRLDVHRGRVHAQGAGARKSAAALVALEPLVDGAGLVHRALAVRLGDQRELFHREVDEVEVLEADLRF